MKKTKPNGPRLKVSALCRYAKHVSGRGCIEGVKLWEHVGNCLVSEGIAWPEEMSAKQFGMSQLEHILGPGFRAPVPKAPPRHPNLAADFYASPQWRLVRMKALKRWGARCLCCGATAATGAVIHVDHIKPRSRHPELALDENNLQTLCEDCNMGKGAWDDTDWRPQEPAA